MPSKSLYQVRNEPLGALGMSRSAKRKLWAYVFIFPQLILFLVFTIYPIAMSYVYSMFEWSGLGPLENFAGLRNFGELIAEPNFWNAFRNSFIFMSGTVILQLPFALVLAIILNGKLKGKTFYRTIYFLPVVTTTAVVGAVMQNIFATDSGLVNHLLLQLSLIGEAIPWLGNGSYALAVLIFVSSWKWFGVKMIYWLAGLQSIPQEVYEAATIDGAGNWKAFRFITLPLLMPVAAVILLLSVVDGLHAFDLVKVMTNGGPGVATEMVDLYIYRFAFSGVGSGLPQIGYASAAGIFFGITVFVISIVLGLLVKWTNGRNG
ncbi:carbohydrate ABC transporter permease [Paenibacillus alba]|uniref:Sugar ABC transporter permease n=1 Tax=Paenibacillus alba TaxID=1197127 RepID=A0ABU6G6F5_9BACL|nr:sugar ABC transporter permease [Paenibacillus alba]MEC0229545.1 sugar ABC transporter permease [Paenibacillus alba]